MKHLLDGKIALVSNAIPTLMAVHPRHFYFFTVISNSVMYCLKGYPNLDLLFTSLYFILNCFSSVFKNNRLGGTVIEHIIQIKSKYYENKII
jgi:hypothetical protein